MSNKPQTLADQKQAVDLFLEALLREPSPQLPRSESPAPQANPAPRLKPAPAVTTPLRLEKPVLEVEAPPRMLPEVPMATPVEQPTEALPPWADVFQAMLFKVAGLTLAVPLEELNGVLELDPDKLTEMPGHADFYLGIMTHMGKSVAVVDTARLVFPPDKLLQLAGDEPLRRVKRVVLINDGKWGLACDEVDEVITLRKDEVRWRSDRTRRRWLLGTVIEYMCALLDTQAFAEKLALGTD